MSDPVPVSAVPSNHDYKDLPSRDLVPDDVAFLRRWIGDSDRPVEELTAHIQRVQADLRASQHVYRCIATFMFLKPRVLEHFALPDAKRIAKERGSGFALLEIGTCLGQDARALILEGIPPSSITASDLHGAYWKAGMDLFLDTESPHHGIENVRAVFGDWAADPSTPGIAAGHVSAFDTVTCFNVLHVLSAVQVDNLLGRIAFVLRPGGIVFGITVGAVEAGDWGATPDGSATRWLHSPATLEAAFHRAGLTNVRIETHEPPVPNAAAASHEGIEGRLVLKFLAHKPPTA